MAGALGTLGASCSCNSASNNRTQQAVSTRTAACNGVHGQKLASHGVARRTQSSRKARCASSMQIRAQQPMLAPRCALWDVGQQGLSAACLHLPRSLICVNWGVMYMASDGTHGACADEQDAGHGWGPIWPAFEATHHLPRWRGGSFLLLSVLHTMFELPRQPHAMRVFIK